MKTRSTSQYIFIISQLVTSIGDQLYNLSLALLIYQQTQSSLFLSLSFAITYGGTTLSFFLIPPLKRFSPVKIMAATDVLSGLLVGSLMVIALVGMDILWAILPLFMLGILRAINKSFAQAVIPRLSQDLKSLSKLNADFQIIASLSMIVGFLLGGIFAAANILLVGLFLNVLSFFICAGLELFIRLNPSEQESAQEQGPEKKVLGQSLSYLQSLTSIIASLRQDPFLAALILPNMLIFGLTIAFNNQIVALISLHTPSKTFYVMTEALMSVGLLLAAVFLRSDRFFKRRTDQVLAKAWLRAITLTGLLYVLACQSPYLLISMVLLFISAVTESISGVTQTELLHIRTNDAYREEIYAFRYITRDVGKVLCTIVVGVIITLVGVSTTLTLVGVTMVGLAVSVWFYLSLSTRRLPLPQVSPADTVIAMQRTASGWLTLGNDRHDMHEPIFQIQTTSLLLNEFEEHDPDKTLQLPRIQPYSLNTGRLSLWQESGDTTVLRVLPKRQMQRSNLDDYKISEDDPDKTILRPRK